MATKHKRARKSEPEETRQDVEKKTTGDHPGERSDHEAIRRPVRLDETSAHERRERDDKSDQERDDKSDEG